MNRAEREVTALMATPKWQQEAQALLELLNEHCDTTITIRFTTAQRGQANLTHNRFSIPEHAPTKGEAYLYYYVIHEFTHCLGFWEHDQSFKKKEQSLLILFGIKIEYSRAYPRALYANGERVYTIPEWRRITC